MTSVLRTVFIGLLGLAAVGCMVGGTQPRTEVTFRLTVEGTVPPGDAFNVSAETGPGPGQPMLIELCGPGTVACKPGVYSQSITVPSGEAVGYAYRRSGDGADLATFQDGSTRTLVTRLVEAKYQYTQP